MSKKRLFEKIKEETGLHEGLIPYYDLFIKSSSLSTGICMFGEIKYEIKKILNNVDDKKINSYYNFLYDTFKLKNLVEDYESPSGTTYPKLIGYNYLNDPEFYLSFRKKGEDGWNGRSLVDKKIQLTVLRHLNNKEEIKEQEFLDMLLN